MAGWEGILPLARGQGKKRNSLYCQDPGEPHSETNCKRRGDHLKLWVLKIASVEIDSFCFGKWIQGLSQHPNGSWKTETEMGPGATDRLHAKVITSMCIHSSGAWPTLGWEGPEPSGMFLPTAISTQVRLSCHPEALQETPRSLV